MLTFLPLIGQARDTFKVYDDTPKLEEKKKKLEIQVKHWQSVFRPLTAEMQAKVKEEKAKAPKSYLALSTTFMSYVDDPLASSDVEKYEMEVSPQTWLQIEGTVKLTKKLSAAVA